jgi:hypothetical protein
LKALLAIENEALLLRILWDVEGAQFQRVIPVVYELPVAMVLVVFQMRSVLIGYSRRIESKRRQICSSLQTNGRWIFGSQKPPSSSGLLRKPTSFLIVCF